MKEGHFPGDAFGFLAPTSPRSESSLNTYPRARLLFFFSTFLSSGSDLLRASSCRWHPDLRRPRRCPSPPLRLRVPRKTRPHHQRQYLSLRHRLLISFHPFTAFCFACSHRKEPRTELAARQGMVLGLQELQPTRKHKDKLLQASRVVETTILHSLKLRGRSPSLTQMPIRRWISKTSPQPRARSKFGSKRRGALQRVSPTCSGQLKSNKLKLTSLRTV